MAEKKLIIVGLGLIAMGFLFIGWYCNVPEIMKHDEILFSGFLIVFIGVIITAIGCWLSVKNS